MTPNQNTLNNTIAKLQKKKKKLQDECEHKFENGYCIYCYKEKK